MVIDSVPYFSVRSSGSSTHPYWPPYWFQMWGVSPWGPKYQIYLGNEASLPHRYQPLTPTPSVHFETKMAAITAEILREKYATVKQSTKHRVLLTLTWQWKSPNWKVRKLADWWWIYFTWVNLWAFLIENNQEWQKPRLMSYCHQIFFEDKWQHSKCIFHRVRIS